MLNICKRNKLPKNDKIYIGFTVFPEVNQFLPNLILFSSSQKIHSTAMDIIYLKIRI